MAEEPKTIGEGPIVSTHGYRFPEPDSVGATIKFVELVHANFEVLEGWHPGFPGALVLVDRESNSAITVQIVESDDDDTAA